MEDLCPAPTPSMTCDEIRSFISPDFDGAVTKVEGAVLPLLSHLTSSRCADLRDVDALGGRDFSLE